MNERTERLRQQSLASEPSISCERAELLTIGAVRIEGRRIKTSSRLELLIKPGAAIDVEAIKVHHLRHIDVENGLPPPP